MKIIVTGGRGYIGSKVTNKLNCDSFDLTDGNDLRIESDCEILSNYDCVIHLGAIADVNECENEQIKAQDTNVLGTQNVLKYAKKIIFSSSASVYGDNSNKVNVNSLVDPISYYGRTKLQAEILINQSNIDSTIFRIFNVHGYDSNSVMDIFKREKQLKVYGDTQRDFISLDQVVDRITKETQIIKGKNIYNLGSGIPTSIKTLAKSTGKAIQFLPPKKNDIIFSCSGLL